MKILSVVGARPQFIKVAVVSRALRNHRVLHEVLVHTGQHYDNNMSAQFFSELDIPEPDYNLGVGSGPQGAQTGRMLAAIEEVLLKEKPEWVLVYGDTNSTLAGALAAAKLHIPIAHVEAGLRSFNRVMPEEINRVLTDHLSELLFAPTKGAVTNLAAEGIRGAKVALVGDVMYDAALLYGERAETSSSILSRLRLTAGEYVLATVHRAENADDAGRLRGICSGLLEISKKRTVVLPLHPRTKAAARMAGVELPPQTSTTQFLVTEPLGYLDMTKLERNAAVIVTDSGGVQKEAYFHRVPCVTLRGETEWVDLVDSGWNRLCPPEGGLDMPDVVLSSVGRKGREIVSYGDGSASQFIAIALLNDPVQHIRPA